MHSAVAGHTNCRPIIIIQSPSHNRATTIVVNTVVTILLLVITIVSSLSSASHHAVASCLPSCLSSASSPPAGCCIASPDAATSHLPGASASHCTVTSCHTRPSRASCPADCCVASPHAAASHHPRHYHCCRCHHRRWQRVFAVIANVCIVVVIIHCHRPADCYVFWGRRQQIVVITIAEIALGVPIIIAITSGAALSLTAIATSVIAVWPTLSSSISSCQPYLCSFVVN